MTDQPTTMQDVSLPSGEEIARVLYEHWVEEDFGNEYCKWSLLLDKDIWLSRSTAILDLLRNHFAGEGNMVDARAIEAETIKRAAEVVDDHGRAWGLAYRSMTDELSRVIRSLDPRYGEGEGR